jgi:hypothetical protein
MSHYYSEGNLIVRTDPYDDLVHECVKSCVNEVKEVEVKVEVTEVKVESNLWKEKVVKEFNNEQNLTKENFPSLG